MKLGATELGKSQLSFALLFMSIRAFSEKKNYFNFSLHVLGGGNCTYFLTCWISALAVQMLEKHAAVMRTALGATAPER